MPENALVLVRNLRAQIANPGDVVIDAAGARELSPDVEQQQIACANGRRLRGRRLIMRIAAVGADGNDGWLVRGDRVGAEFLQDPLLQIVFGQIRFRIHSVLEFIDADGSKCGNDGASSTFVGHILGSLSQRPPAPGEADDRGCSKSDEGSLQQTSNRFSLQDWRYLHGVSFRPTCFGARVTDTRMGSGG